MEAIVELSDYSSDDSESDPTYTELDRISNLCIKPKSKSSVVEEIDSDTEIAESEIDEVDEKSFEEVQRIIQACEIEKLKVEQCKVYLRKNGLRLTGNKATLIHRIREHLEISNGGGERKYPASSFVVNCTGDACTGDVVLFRQNVYDTFSVVSRSASGPPCGTRLVAGRIVKESYGAAKQQHTFTVEVLWSKGENPHPPLHPLRIKGRNLYRMQTLRQKWEDEEERRKLLIEKHSRGSKRESRIQEKENRKILKKNRILKKETNTAPSQFNSTSAPKPSLQPQQGNTGTQAIRLKRSVLSSKPPSSTVTHQTSLASNSGKPVAEKVTTNRSKQHSIQDKHIDQAAQSIVGNRSFNNRESMLHTQTQRVQPFGSQPHRSFNDSNFFSGNHMNQSTKFYKNPFFCIDNRPVSPFSGQQHCSNYNNRPTSSSRQYNENYYRPERPYQVAQ